MKTGFRLVFRGGVCSRTLPENEVRAAIARVLKLDDEQIAQLFADQVFTLDKAFDQASALNCVAYLQKLGLDVVLDQPHHAHNASAPHAAARWLSDSGFGSGFTQTQLNMARAEELLQGFAPDADARPPFAGADVNQTGGATPAKDATK